jgi:short-subunit dehydrogenase
MKKTALITGASSGIGKEMAKIHAAKGGDLIVVARRKEKLEALQQEIQQSTSAKVIIMVKDLTEPNAPKEIYEEVQQLGLTVDYLINNAGFGGRGKFHERAWADDLSMIQLNIVALTALTRYFLPDFVKRNSGKILNVSSTASLMPGPLQAVYFASKAYVTSFSNAIAEELYNTNVTVTALLPGATDTEFAQTADMDKTELFKHTFTAKEVANTGYNAMLKGDLDVLAGVTFAQKVMMKSVALTPKKILLTQVRKMQELK